jgi:hypothetical protein
MASKVNDLTNWQLHENGSLAEDNICVWIDFGRSSMTALTSVSTKRRSAILGVLGMCTISASPQVVLETLVARIRRDYTVESIPCGALSVITCCMYRKKIGWQSTIITRGH